jgi:Ala-tRNA(Pro) deacylase
MTDAPERETAASEADLLALLDRIGVAYRRHVHPPLHTVEESRALRGELPGGHTKNLFLKDRKGGFWLATCLEDRRISVNDLSRVAEAKRMSFGSAEDLWRTIGVRPGAVTPFALMNDADGAVRLILDRRMLERDPLNFHPLHNEATLAVSPDGLMRFFAETGHAPLILDFDELEALAAARADGASHCRASGPGLHQA